MSISSINGVARVAPTSPDGRAPGNDPQTARSDVALVTPVLDTITNQPVPPRFPWLSRLSAQLEPTATQKPAFPSAPQLGDNLDQAV
jgi:hypothetical protein